MSASRKRQSPHSRTRCTYIYATQDTTPACFYFPGYSTAIKKHNQNDIDKSQKFQLYQYRSDCVFYCSRIARKAEAGGGGILRSINISATCPAMWRLTFSGGGHLVRLSANGCQPHRPNTALLFCAAGYRPGLLRTLREYSQIFYMCESTFRHCDKKRSLKNYYSFIFDHDF